MLLARSLAAPLAPALAALLACACGSPLGPAPGDGGGTGSGGGSGGGGSGGAGSGGGGSTAPTVTISRADADPECDALVPPPAPPPVLASRSAPGGATCLGGTADGTGHLAVGARDASGVSSWQAFAPDGTALRTFSGAGLDALVREPEGWQGAVAARDATGSVQRVDVVTFAPDGSESARAQVSRPASEWTAFAWRLASDPLGGTFVASGARSLGGNHWWVLDGVRVGADGAVGSSPSVASGSDGPYFVVAGVSTTGAALAGWRREGGEEEVQWLGPDGAARTQVLDDGLANALVGTAPLDVELHAEAMLDGAVALRVGGAWRWTYPPLGTREAAPPWLSSRPGTALRLTRGNRGYALLPGAGVMASPCEQVVEVLAPSGRLCATVTVRQGSGACTTGPVEQGWDGTLVVASATDRCDASGCTCSAWSWPRLLGGP